MHRYLKNMVTTLILEISYPCCKNIFQFAGQYSFYIQQITSYLERYLIIIYLNYLKQLAELGSPIYIKHFHPHRATNTSTMTILNIKKDIETYEDLNVNYIDIFCNCISEINKRIKPTISMK